MKKFMMMLVLFAMLFGTGCTYHQKMTTSWKPITFYYNRHLSVFFFYKPGEKKEHKFLNTSGVPPMAPSLISSSRLDELKKKLETRLSEVPQEYAPHEQGTINYFKAWLKVGQALQLLDQCIKNRLKNCRIDNALTHLKSAKYFLGEAQKNCTIRDSRPSSTVVPCDFNPPPATKAFEAWLGRLTHYLRQHQNTLPPKIARYNQCQSDKVVLKRIHFHAYKKRRPTGKVRLIQSKFWTENVRIFLCSKPLKFDDVSWPSGYYDERHLPKNHSCEYFGTKKVVFSRKDNLKAVHENVTVIRPIKYIYLQCQYPFKGGLNFEKMLNFD